MIKIPAEVPEWLKGLPVIPPPHEILEIPDGKCVELDIMGWEVGRMLIHPRYPGAPPEKWIKAIRVKVPPEKKKIGPPYWDITPGTLVAQLEPLLASLDYRKYIFRICAHGVAPKKRFSIEVIPKKE